MDRSTLVRAAEALGSEPDQDRYASLLESAGFGKAEADALTDILPEAFAIPVLEELGVSTVEEIASARTRRGKWVDIYLSKCDMFVEALSLARKHRATGILDQDTYRAIAEKSALVAAANKALNAGDSLEGGKVSIAFLGAAAETLGYRPWYRRFW